MAIQSDTQRLDADAFYRDVPMGGTGRDEMAMQEMYDRFHDEGKDELM